MMMVMVVVVMMVMMMWCHMHAILNHWCLIISGTSLLFLWAAT